ncbi:alpha/beta fold hydrolase [Actinomadura sp. NEAU-AAG7]|uniref:alpha/beta fold hydrolase n=1 Tax=Actinomadura sp. NEAU-AAG7 TaxID=2839640 RepID=UPI001BE409CA|nr:alpha/beta hydrolase [Actinomadura sp. NEAU-AAG7]MBT2210003.1 alpha/beta hydrolase [Actinomadura sp. NEAU-AAG7]
MSRNPTPFTDFGGDGVEMLAVHGHFGGARTFASLAHALAGRVRVTAVDQRGHGHAAHRDDYGVDAYVADLAAFVRDRDMAPAVLYGHSMGGVVAFHLAARHPELVRALVLEDAPVVVEPPVLDTRPWTRRTATLMDLGAAVIGEGIPDPAYFLEGAIRYPDGWGLPFDHEGLFRSEELLLGEYWTEWLAVRCPALLMHGTGSFVLPTALAREMAERRPGTSYVEFPGCGHWIHDDDVAGVASAVTEFLGAAGLTSERRGSS